MAIEYLPGWGLDLRITIANLFIHWGCHTDSKKLLTFWFHNFLNDGSDMSKKYGLHWAFVIGFPFRDLLIQRYIPCLTGGK